MLILVLEETCTENQEWILNSVGDHQEHPQGHHHKVDVILGHNNLKL
jgi:hypothetical protein